MLAKAAKTDLGDYFEFEIGGVQLELAGPLYGGARYPVRSLIDGRLFVSFHVDVAVGDFIPAKFETAHEQDLLSFAGVKPAAFPLIPKEVQFAEKLHSYTMPRPVPNSRVRDLVDMVLLIQVVIYPRNRPGLERLVEYCSRPALSLSRLIYASATKTVIYRAERRDGKPELMTMDALEFLRRWGLLMPPSHKNLVHYYGALAPRSPLRRALTAKAEKEAKRILAAERSEKLKNKARSWAACLARVLEVFPLICPKCDLELKPVAVIFKDKELARLLNHFGLPAEFPKFRPVPAQSLYAAKRGPPDEDCQLDPRVDQYDSIDPPAPED